LGAPQSSCLQRHSATASPRGGRNQIAAARRVHSGAAAAIVIPVPPRRRGAPKTQPREPSQ
ncbi:MAG TPA: hypothetical protein PLZ80_12480, partial [Planctomycetota bacterium]|nr:hypothetical protein [Planctomycetota bacterium]